MGLRWRKSIGGSKGPRLNLSLRGLGLSFGTRGLRLGIGRRGPTVSAGIPGTGLYFFKTIGRGRARRAPRQPTNPPPLPSRQVAPQTFRPAPAMTREEIDALNAKQRPILIGFGILIVLAIIVSAFAALFDEQHKTPAAQPPTPPAASVPKTEADSITLTPRTIYHTTAPVHLYNVPSNATIAYTLAAGGFLTTMETPRGASLFQKVSLTDGQTNFEYYMDTTSLKAGQLTPYIPPQPSTSLPASSAPVTAVQPRGDFVYIGHTGDKFHCADCMSLKGKAIPISREDAIRRGYTVCGICQKRCGLR